MAHQLAGGDPDFSSIKLLEVFLLSHGWEASPSQGDFPMQCRGLGLDSNPGPLNQASSALTIRPPSVSPIYIYHVFILQSVGLFRDLVFILHK